MTSSNAGRCAPYRNVAAALGEYADEFAQTAPAGGGPTRFMVEGLDRLGKDTLVQGIQDRLGQHVVLHHGKPPALSRYSDGGRLSADEAKRRYQVASFEAMFELLAAAPRLRVICNRAHLGECVYAPLYRGYDGGYAMELERAAAAAGGLRGVRLVLLVEDFATSRHFADDGLSLGGPDKRRREQELFTEAYGRSAVADKRTVCVTDPATGLFRDKAAILDEVLA